MTVELDARFGALFVPDRIDPVEATLAPRSLQRLTQATALHLKNVLAAAEAGLGVVAYVYDQLPVLWIVDAAGDLWFAIEEVVQIETREFIQPRLRGAAVGSGLARLGHPALIGAQAGRIGGELFFDSRAARPKWFLTNRSGRYGLGKDRKIEHLESVAAIFAAFGMSIDTFFVQPRGAP